MSALPPIADIGTKRSLSTKSGHPYRDRHAVTRVSTVGLASNRSISHRRLRREQGSRPIFNGWTARVLTRKLHLASIPLHQTARAGCAQVRAQFFGTRAALRSDVDPGPAHAAARKPVVNDVWLAA